VRLFVTEVGNVPINWYLLSSISWLSSFHIKIKIASQSVTSSTFTGEIDSIFNCFWR